MALPRITNGRLAPFRAYAETVFVKILAFVASQTLEKACFPEDNSLKTLVLSPR